LQIYRVYIGQCPDCFLVSDRDDFSRINCVFANGRDEHSDHISANRDAGRGRDISSFAKSDGRERGYVGRHENHVDYSAGDFCQTVSIAFRDEYATTYFQSLTAPLNSVGPLYADDPRQSPFTNAENQLEWRWSLDAHLQVNETISIPQTYADSVTIILQEVS